MHGVGRDRLELCEQRPEVIWSVLAIEKQLIKTSARADFGAVRICES